MPGKPEMRESTMAAASVRQRAKLMGRAVEPVEMRLRGLATRKAVPAMAELGRGRRWRRREEGCLEEMVGKWKTRRGRHKEEVDGR